MTENILTSVCIKCTVHCDNFF